MVASASISPSCFCRADMPHTSAETAHSPSQGRGTEKGTLISTPRRPSCPFTSSVAVASPSNRLPSAVKTASPSARCKVTASSVSE